MKHTAVLLFLLWLSGCATYSANVRGPRSAIEQGRFDDAISDLTKLAEKKDNDELLYLMDLGLAYHSAGRYAQAIDVFHKADELAEIKDYTSISEEAATVLVNEDVKKYRGEDFEKLMVNMYLAIDYTLLGKWEDALVEARRVNQKLDRMISEGNLPYEQNAFAKYLDALLFEAQKEYNDAFVDYRQLLKWNRGDFPYLGTPLLRLADRLKASQEFDEYRRRYPDASMGFRIGKGEGEIILLLEQGKAPIKVPHPNFSLLPTFQRRSFYSDYVWLRDRGGRFKVRTYSLYDIEETAIRELDHRIGLITAKKIGGLVAKEAAAIAVEKATDSELAGSLTRIALLFTDHADTRSWSTLPAQLQLARVKVPAGRHQVVLDMVTAGGSEISSVKEWPAVDVRPGQLVFLHYRTKD